MALATSPIPRGRIGSALATATAWSATMLASLVAMSALPIPARAEDAAPAYPSRTIRFVVPFPAGGPSDIIARVIGEKLATVAGQAVVIENRAGAGGITGVAAVAKSTPDGYTIGIATSGTLAMNVALQEKMPYDPTKDLLLLTQAVSVPELLVVGPAVPAKTFAELIAAIKAAPGTFNFASTGPGSMPHMAGELLKHTAGLDIVHLPYTGAAPAVNDLLGGHVQMLFADIPVLLGSVQSGQLKALAIGSKSRSPSLPDVPTTAELGLPDVEADNWYGLVAPAALPVDVASVLTADIKTVLADDAVVQRLAKQGIIVVGSSSAEFVAYVERETARWSKLTRAAGIKLR